ncbi:MAG TPA: hypothetical protein VMG12_16165 [Polyangiaceae bacterium]|nr:hypothetical protein [Polyangiaceae bacterium]
MRGCWAAAVCRWICRSAPLFAVACSGSDETSITQLALRGTPAGDAAPSHPIAFASNRYSDERSDIVSMALDGSVQPVTQGQSAFQPRWSPSGSSLAYREQVENTYAEVGLVAPDGTERVVLTTGELSIFGEFPVAWAPDESGVAFATRREGDTTRIWFVPREGGPGAPWLAGDSVDRRELAWSSDARRIAFADYDRGASRHSDGISKDLWVADAADPLRAINVTMGRVYAPINVRWAPDSRRIAFQGYALAADGSIEAISAHEESGPYMPPDYETFIIDVDTTELTRVTADAADEKGVAWSPDGTELLISSDRDGDFDLWLVSLVEPGRDLDLIDDNDDPFDDYWPDWFAARR